MEKITINGYEFCNFGENNYSNGMQLITSTDRPTEILEKVKLQEPGFECVWFNPSAPCNDFEFFGVLGTEEQYKKFYQNQRDSQISKRICEQGGLGLPIYAYRELRDTIESEYKDWWE